MADLSAVVPMENDPLQLKCCAIELSLICVDLSKGLCQSVRLNLCKNTINPKLWDCGKAGKLTIQLLQRLAT